MKRGPVAPATPRVQHLCDQLRRLRAGRPHHVTFKGAFERRRYLAPADADPGWTGEKGDKTRWRLERPTGTAGPSPGWDRAETSRGVLESFAIVTTASGADSAAIHDRQPVILEKTDFSRWPDLSADVAPLMAPSPAGTRVAQQA